MATKKKTKTRAAKPRVLDEDRAAEVIAEYLSITNVTTAEIERVTTHAGALTSREIALAFRVSEVLEIRDPFLMPRRFELAFKRARDYFIVQDMVSKARAARDASAEASS